MGKNKIMFGFYQTKNMGNNAIDFEKRKLYKNPKIWVNNFVIGDIFEKFELGNEIVFEVYEDNKIKSYIGLKYFILDLKRKIFLVDNHNYILGAWLIYEAKQFIENKYDLIHIDQHSDLKDFDENINKNKLIEELFLKTNVGNYIKPMKKYKLINKDIQVRTEYSLLNLKLNDKFLLNIDLDFRDPKMKVNEDTFKKVKYLISKAEFTFVATSPYFLDQNYVLDLLNRLLQ